MSSYTELYAVPKDSFDKYLKYRIGNFPNVRNLKVQQLNFNEAKKLNTYQQHNTPSQNADRLRTQVNLTTGNLANPTPLGIRQNFAEENPKRNLGSGQRLGDNEFNFGPANPDDDNLSNLDNVSEIIPPDVPMRNEANTQRMNDLQANAIWDPAIIKHSNTTQDPNQTAQNRPQLQERNAFDELLNRSPTYNEHSFQGDQSTMTNAHSNDDQTIFYASNKRSNKKPSTSTPEFAFKRLEKSLKDISTNNRPRGTKDFIAANKAAAKTHNRTNQSKASTSKKRNPRQPNLNNSKPVASNTRSQAPSFNKSSVRQQQNIKEKSDKLQKSAQR